MGRIIAATIAGGLIMYVWLMLAWMALGIHDSTMKPVPGADDVTAALKRHELQTGVYHYPGMPDVPADASEEQVKQAWDDMTALHEAGPIYSIYYHQPGFPVMGPATLGSAVLLDFVSAAIAAVLLWSAAPRLPNYWCRVAFVGLLGLFAALMSHVSYFIWMAFPLDYTLAMCVDLVVGWLLVGLATAAIIRPPAGDDKAAKGA